METFVKYFIYRGITLVMIIDGKDGFQFYDYLLACFESRAEINE